jgi:6-phosphogluconolactonase (cycloisomerase 2 family)
MVEFSSNQVRYVASAYDSTNDKIVVAYRETAAGPDVGMAVVGTVSGTSISFGTPVQFEAGQTNYIDIVFDPDTSKVIIAYEDDTNFSYGAAIVGTVSGTSISFGTAVVFSSFNTRYTSIIYDTNADRVAIAFTKYDGFQQGWGIAGQVSGTSISFGSAVRFDTDNSSFTVEMIDLTFDSTNNKVINIYKGNNNRFQGVIGTISGTAISWGTPVDVNTSTDSRYPCGSFDTNAGKIFIAYKDNATDYVLGVVGTVSGTSISFGTAVTLASVGVNGEVSAAYNPDTQNHKVIYGSLVSPFPIRQFTATVSGTSVSASGDRAVTSDQGQVYQSGLTYDTNTNQFVSASRTTSSEVGGGLVYVSPAGASNTDFIGITDQAIADTATGAVIVQGGVSEKLSGLTVGADYYVQNDGSLSSPTAPDPYNLSGAVYDNINLSVASEATDPQGIAFNADGTKIFVVDASGDDVNEYSLSTAYNVSTGSFVRNFSLASQDSNPQDIAFNTNGTKMFVVGYTGQDVNEYTLSTGFDISTASYSQNFSVASQDTGPAGLAFNTDGTKMFISGITNDNVYEYTLSTSFDVSTASFVDSFSFSAQVTDPRGIEFSSDGTILYLVDRSTDSVYQYNLTVGFDISTASYSGASFSVASQDTNPHCAIFNGTGSKMYVTGRGTDIIYQYSLNGSTSSVPAGRALSSTSILLEG